MADRLTLRALPAQAGHRRATFVASTEVEARDGLVVEAKGWQLANFRANPVLLWAHRSDQPPIGRVTRIEVRGGRLEAETEAGVDQGVNPFADMVWKLIEAGLVRAVSVGFLPTKWNKDLSRVLEAELLELSVVPVPADPQALAVARALAPSAVVDELFVRQEAEPGRRAKAAAVATTRGQDRPQPDPNNRYVKGNPMDFAKRMAELEDRLGALHRQIDDLVAAAETEDRDLSAAETQRHDELTREAEELAERRTRLEAREKARAAAVAAPVQRTPAPAPVGGRVQVGNQQRAPGMLPVHMLRAVYHGRGSYHLAASIAEQQGDPELAAVLRAAVEPAQTSVSGWASQLVDQQMRQFQEMLQPASVYARVSGIPVPMTVGKITLPVGTGDIGGGFFAENTPLPVKKGTFGSVDIEPAMLGVITTATKKLLAYGLPQTDAILQRMLITGTAKVLDAAFIDSDAGTTGLRPAGLQASGAGTRTSAGNTVENIETDAAVLFAALDAINAPQSRLVWLMPPVRRRNLAAKLLANGTYPFASVDQGVFKGIPIIESSTITSTVVGLLDQDLLFQAGVGAPMIALSEDATLHMEDTAPDEIVDSGGASTPVYSMFQMDSVAMKLVFPTGWTMRLKAGAQWLTSVGW